VLFIDTKLEFPETVEYVKELAKARNLRLHVISREDGDGGFFHEASPVRPPSKDYRWCCKTNKLGPLTSFIQNELSERMHHGGGPAHLRVVQPLADQRG